LPRGPRLRFRVLHPVIHGLRAHQHAGDTGAVQPVRAGPRPRRPAAPPRAQRGQGGWVWWDAWVGLMLLLPWRWQQDGKQLHPKGLPHPLPHRSSTYPCLTTIPAAAIPPHLPPCPACRRLSSY
jgi:hypothetical protein